MSRVLPQDRVSPVRAPIPSKSFLPAQEFRYSRRRARRFGFRPRPTGRTVTAAARASFSRFNLPIISATAWFPASGNRRRTSHTCARSSPGFNPRARRGRLPPVCPTLPGFRFPDRGLSGLGQDRGLRCRRAGGECMGKSRASHPATASNSSILKLFILSVFLSGVFGRLPPCFRSARVPPECRSLPRRWPPLHGRSIVAGLPFPERLVGPQQLFGKCLTHFR